MPSAVPGRASAAAARRAQAAGAVARAAPPRPRGLLPEGVNNPVAATSLVGLAAFAGYVLYSAAHLPTVRAAELPPDVPVAPGLAAASAPAAQLSAAAPGIPGVTANGLPQTADDSSRMIRVLPARRPTFALEQGARAEVPSSALGAPAGPAEASPDARAAVVAVPVAPTPAAASPAGVASGGPDGYDRLRLRGGRVLRGRVELVRVAAVVFRDADTGLRYEYPKADVDAVVTEFGSTVRFSPGDARSADAASSGRAGATPAERASARLVRRGVGGRYLVRFTVESVNGSPECRRGWDVAPPPDWARVTHVPGADTLAVTFEGGSTFASVIDEQAQFASTFVIVPDQAYTGSALTTRLSGRFAAGGFDAAVNLVGYRRVREGRDVACHTVLRAVGRLQGR